MKAVKQDVKDIKGDVKVIKCDIDGLGASFRREVRAQSSYRGNYAQSAARADVLEIAALFEAKYGLELAEAHQVSRNRLRDWLRDSRELVESLNLRPRALRTFRRPDTIAEVRDLYAGDDSDPVFYITMEASYTGDAEDIRRATEHAKIVRAVTGLDTYPVVAAVELDDELDAETLSRLYYDVERFIEAGDDNAALWYPLDSADLRPSEPR